jgi:hypothetical protein
LDTSFDVVLRKKFRSIKPLNMEILKKKKKKFNLIYLMKIVQFHLHCTHVKLKNICNIGFVQLVHNVQNKILHILIVMYDQLKLIICLKSKKKKEEVKQEEFEDTFFNSIH